MPWFILQSKGHEGIEIETVGNPGNPGIGTTIGGMLKLGGDGSVMSIEGMVSDTNPNPGIPGIGMSIGGILKPGMGGRVMSICGIVTPMVSKPGKPGIARTIGSTRKRKNAHRLTTPPLHLCYQFQ
jgi:hypothetical protein